VNSLAQNVYSHIRREELLRAGDRVGIAVSGGIDSVGLLRIMLELRSELGIVISVVHFNHKLRGAESEADQEFVAGLARKLGLEFYVESGDVAQLAAEEHSGLEAAARELRYGFFRELLGAGGSVGGLDTPGAEALDPKRADRSAESAAPPKGMPQGLKPGSNLVASNGAAEAAPLQSKIPTNHLDKIATGHTLDDQAETVLMRMIRGTGMRGLGGIYPRVLVQEDDRDEDESGEGQGEIVRPLLGVRRRELEKYLREIGQPWREDSSNADSKFTRNRLRKLVLPLLEREFNPAVVESLAELAAIARDEEDYWENEVSGWLGTVVQWSEPEWTRGLPGFREQQALVQILPSQAQSADAEVSARLEEGGPAVMNASISRPWLLTEPRAVQRRVLKAVGEQAGIALEFKHVEEILRFAEEDGPTGKELSLPLGWKLVREPEAIVFITPDLRSQKRIPDYEYPLSIPGRAFVPEIEGVVEALLLPPGADFAEYNSQQLLRAELLPPELKIRNWRAGDRFWPAHTKAAKKVKELLQERQVREPDRRLWPVVANGPEILWMRGFPVPASFRARAGEQGVLIREVPVEEFDSESA
jgi:tRNA(Ile)-lysidine synthase